MPFLCGQMNHTVTSAFQQGRQCVHIAAENGCCDVLKVLHGVRANLNAADKVHMSFHLV